MGILSILSTPRSRQFRRLSARISELHEHNTDGHFDEELKQAYITFFQTLVKDSFVGHICSKYQLTPGELQKTSTKLLNLGMGWRRRHYIPVEAFTYKDTFYFVMDRQHLLKGEDCLAVSEYLFRFF